MYQQPYIYQAAAAAAAAAAWGQQPPQQQVQPQFFTAQAPAPAPVHQFIHPNVQPAASQLQFNQPPKSVPNQLGQLNPTQVLFIFLFTNLAFADRVKIKKYVKNE